MRQLTLQQKLDMANKTAHGLMQEVDEQKKKQKALADENDHLKAQVKHLCEENTKADAIIADREECIKRTDARNEQLRSEHKDFCERMNNDREEIRSLQLQIRKLTNDLEEVKLNNSSTTSGLKFGSLLDRWNSEGGKLSLSSVPIGGYLDLSNPTPPQTAAQKILNILKQLEPERMVFEFSQVSKEVNRIIAYNKAKAMAASDMLSKPE